MKLSSSKEIPETATTNGTRDHKTDTAFDTMLAKHMSNAFLMCVECLGAMGALKGTRLFQRSHRLGSSIKKRITHSNFDELGKLTWIVLDKVKPLNLIITRGRKRVETENLGLKPGKVFKDKTSPSIRFH